LDQIGPDTLLWQLFVMTELSKEQLNTFVEEALDVLKKDRDREILVRRGGINTTAQTLEQIGQDLKITRERVRQIEKVALNKIRSSYDSDNDFTRTTARLVAKKGGLVSLKTLHRELKAKPSAEAHIVFLIKISPRLLFVERNDHYGRIISLNGTYDEQAIKKLHGVLVETMQKHGKPTKITNLSKLIDGPHSQDSLEELAQASNHLAVLEGNWGLSRWPEVNPKSIKDKIYLILKRAGRPLHFTEIAEQISNLSANPKRVTTQAVHNELIKDSRFVLIGRGIYALGEWGYRSGTVADIIEEILKEENGALAKDEIIRRVLSRRQVKTTTIVLNLQEKPQFKRVEKGIYSL